MILKLVQAELRSDRFLILIASLVAPVMWLGEAGRMVPGASTLSLLIYGQTPFLILFLVLEVRRLNQKRRRLLTQLPVSGIAVRIASWLEYLPIIAVACAISAVILVFYPPVPEWGWRGFIAAGALLIAALFSVAALVRIFWLGTSLRPPWNYIIWPAIVIVYLLLNQQWSLLFEGEGPFRVGGIIRWEPLMGAAFGLALALVAADLLLDRLADDHLR